MEKLNKKISIDELKKQELFKSINVETLINKLSVCDIYSIQKKEILIRARERNNNIYLILSGTFNVFISKSIPESISILEKGQTIGEISVIDHKPASAFVEALEDSTVLLIDGDLMWSLINSSNAVAYNLLLILTQNVRLGNSKLYRAHSLLKEFKHNVTIDDLTGLYNRRWLKNMMERVVKRCYKNKEKLSVMMIDIDNFKNYNDENGHIAGDTALRNVSKTITQHLRPEDMISRYGGEELFALLPGIEIKNAINIAERLRERIKTMTLINNEGEKIPNITVSIGIATMKGVTSSRQLIEEADKAMYKAKDKGKDQVCI